MSDSQPSLVASPKAQWVATLRRAFKIPSLVSSDEVALRAIAVELADGLPTALPVSAGLERPYDGPAEARAVLGAFLEAAEAVKLDECLVRLIPTSDRVSSVRAAWAERLSNAVREPQAVPVAAKLVDRFFGYVDSHPFGPSDEDA